MAVDYKIKSRIWLEGENGTFLAEGRINLLKSIKETGSISAAAKSMNMSYRKAWEQVNAMNLESKSPLVEKTSGGVSGGGTIVTEEGEKAIKVFEAINKRCRNFLEKEIKKYDL